MIEIVFNKQSWGAIKEKMEKGKYISEGPVSDLQHNPSDAAVNVSHKADKVSDKFMGEKEVEKLQYPKVKKESNMDKTAAQELPGKGTINPADAQFMEKGDKEKLQFPSKPAADPKPSLKSEKDAQKQIDPGEKEKLTFPSSGGPKIKVDWNVATDKGIGSNYMEAGEKEKLAKPSDQTPDVSAPRLKDAEGANMSEAPKTTPIQKQFAINWKKYSAEEIRPIVDEAINCAISDLQVVAYRMGVDIQKTPLADAMNHLIRVKAEITEKGLVHLIADNQEEPQAALKSKVVKAAEIKVQASAKEENPAADISDADKKSLGKVGNSLFS